ncbi:MAG: hypothetical protein EHM24_18460 [Acidobacteria bacterium]|nr:MAG: hypothetical protein EHM24_18460 [Acidobacteriota bacterium]
MSGMGTGAVFLLGVIAFSTLAIAVSQIGLFIYLGRLWHNVEEQSRRLERDIRPLLTDASTVANNAARASALAVAQVERADRLFSELAGRVDETAAVIQQVVLAPAREGRALLAGFGAALSAFRALREASARNRALRAEEDDPLFIG